MDALSTPLYFRKDVASGPLRPSSSRLHWLQSKYPCVPSHVSVCTRKLNGMHTWDPCVGQQTGLGACISHARALLSTGAPSAETCNSCRSFDTAAV